MADSTIGGGINCLGRTPYSSIDVGLRQWVSDVWDCCRITANYSEAFDLLRCNALIHLVVLLFHAIGGTDVSYRYNHVLDSCAIATPVRLCRIALPSLFTDPLLHPPKPRTS